MLHGLELGGGADTRHRETDVDGRADTLVEELSLQEDLAVGDGNDVGGDISRHITALGLNDGQSSHGATAVLVVHLGRTLEQTRVEVEDITGIGLATGRATENLGVNTLNNEEQRAKGVIPEEKRHLAVGDGLLGQIVEDDQGVLSIITEPHWGRQFKEL